ncbi:acyltransferase family protein [Actinopolymorpha singaporensis]|uniref:acyltransferase family protein n=1 Tax=Actinopolymorpha singaporensis TaxID=117157 RepID=UPI0012FDDCD1|nr:acyltransferase family protein [Actinopolymorpha singaporensis]
MSRLDIQGLRAVAILSVLLYHIFPRLLPGGFLGVDIFFVISGFLITGILTRELQRTGRIRLGRFWARRVRRLLPMASLVTALTLVTSIFVYSPLRVPELATDARWVALYLPNYWFAARQTDYLANQAPPSPFQHFWSLAVEEQYYFCWPILMLAAVLAATRIRCAPVANLRLLLLGLTAMITAVSMLVSWQLTQPHQPWAFFGLPARAWELSAGGLLAITMQKPPRLSRAVATASVGAGIVLLTGSLIWFSADLVFPGLWPVIPIAGTLLLLWAGNAPRAKLLHVLTENKSSVYVGTISYSLYLWHWPVLILSRARFGFDHEVALGAGCIAVSLALSCVSYRFLENPVRQSARLRRVVWPNYALLFASTTTVLAACTATASVSATHGSETVRRPENSSAQPPGPTPRSATTVSASTVPTTVPATTRPSLEIARKDQPALGLCGVAFHIATPRVCQYGDHKASKSMVLFGDSHAAQWFTPISSFARQHGYKIFVILKSSCPAASNYRFVSYAVGREFYECESWVRRSIGQINHLRPDIIVVSNATLGYTEPIGGHYPDAWHDGLSRTFAALPSATKKILILDTPRFFETPPTECLAAHLNDPASCGVDVTKTISQGARSAEKAAAEAHQVNVVDPVPWLCTKTCYGIVGDIIMYADSNHMTNTFASTLSRRLAVQLGNLLR